MLSSKPDKTSSATSCASDLRWNHDRVVRAELSNGELIKNIHSKSSETLKLSRLLSLCRCPASRYPCCALEEVEKAVQRHSLCLESWL